ncbi:MAG: purine-nucleoside phosphorylase [Bacteroidales bacterium]|nr:purine-nucleoside phosphorylase [Bacteroidales bacterium]
MDERTIRIHEAADYIRERIGDRQPIAGIVLGSGLGKLADMIEDPIVIPFVSVPHFPLQTALGHKGNLIVGQLGGKCVIAMQGRYHYYENYPMETVTLPIRVMKVLGISYLFVSNAAGGVNPDFNMGDMMIIKDHINMLPNPLIGPNFDEFGPRFPDMTQPYSLELIAKAEAICERLGLTPYIRKGVYLACSGPAYETPGEYRFYKIIGADSVGMSTVPEVIVARHMSIPVFGVSIVTDLAHFSVEDDYVTDGEEILKAADAAADKMCALFINMIAEL